MEETPRIKTRKNHGCCVYHDTSLKYRRRDKNGRMHEVRHDCWRADIHGMDTGGGYRLRRRFKTREEALAFLRQFK